MWCQESDLLLLLTLDIYSFIDFFITSQAYQESLISFLLAKLSMPS